jgi:hypothetical protein
MELTCTTYTSDFISEWPINWTNREHWTKINHGLIFHCCLTAVLCRFAQLYKRLLGPWWNQNSLFLYLGFKYNRGNKKKWLKYKIELAYGVIPKLFLEDILSPSKIYYQRTRIHHSGKTEDRLPFPQLQPVLIVLDPNSSLVDCSTPYEGINHSPLSWERILIHQINRNHDTSTSASTTAFWRYISEVDLALVIDY